MFHWWESLIAASVANAGMTALTQMGKAMGMTSMHFGLMLGSMFRRDPAGARTLGWALHAMNGLVFGLIYAAAWAALDPAEENAWWVGLLFGAVHGVIVLFVMPMMSTVHPRVRPDATVATGPAGEVILPRFGFGGVGFGRGTPMGIMMGHLVFGLVWGLVFMWLI